MSDRQLRSHTARPGFVPAQWSDHSDHEDAGNNLRSRFRGPRQVPTTPASGFNHPSTPANIGDIPLSTRPRASSIPPTIPRPSVVQPPPYLSARPTATHLQYSCTMPSPGDRSAPRFDGHPPSLKCFFDEVDYLGDSCGLLAVEKIQYTLRYLDFREYETWRSCSSVRGSNWDVFRAEITELYPGADENRKYMVVDLEILVDKQGCEPMQLCYQFGEYYQCFVTISDWLLSQQEISIQDQNKLFIRGFDHPFQDWLTSRLCMKNPNHSLHCPWPMDDVTESAWFFLASNSAASKPDHYSYPSYNSQTSFSTQAPLP